MVDRANLIKQLEPRVRPSGSQAEAIRKAMDKTLTELVLALPINAVQQLSQEVKADLAALIGMIDQKTCEKLAAAWEPKRKLDAELKSRVKKDILALIESKRLPYEPITVSLVEARKSDREAVSATLRSAAPVKDLKALAKKWDKNWRPAQESRTSYVDRLIALIDGTEPAARAPRT